MSRRILSILFLLVGVSLLVVAGYLFVTQQDQPRVAEVATSVAAEDLARALGLATPEEPLIEVVVSLQTVPRGYQMTADELAIDLRLASEVGRNVITNKADAVGLFARSDIYQGQTLTHDALVADPRTIGLEDFGPSSLIPPGSVAAAVPMDRLSGVAYGLQPGDYVDVLVTFLFYQIDQQFQTYLPNAAVFFLEDVIEAAEGDAVVERTIKDIAIIFPYGRFEELATGDIAHIAPSEAQRPVPVAMILQNARVIQVGAWTPPGPVLPPTPTPTPAAEASPDDRAAAVPTLAPTPTPTPDVLLLALSPQQQLFLKYAVESNANIDFALRGHNDNQIYAIDNVDLPFLLEQFGFTIPPNFNFSVDSNILQNVPVTPTATPSISAPEGG